MPKKGDYLFEPNYRKFGNSIAAPGITQLRAAPESSASEHSARIWQCAMLVRRGCAIAD